MEPPIFYASPQQCMSTPIVITGSEARHAVSVMRLKAGAAVLVIDGNGTAYRGHIDRIAPRKQIVEIIPYDTIRNFGEPEVIVTLGAGLPTGHKFSTTIEKGTELGVRRFVPIVCEKSKVKIDGQQKTRARVTRFERVALAAVKQCRRAYRPEISLPVSFDAFLRQTDNSELRILFNPSQPATRLEKVISGKNQKRVTLLVGPESGFSVGELAEAAQAGFTTVSMGRRILRSETAGPVAVSLVMHLLGELS